MKRPASSKIRKLQLKPETIVQLSLIESGHLKVAEGLIPIGTSQDDIVCQTTHPP
jgi:hypothetical protein